MESRKRTRSEASQGHTKSRKAPSSDLASVQREIELLELELSNLDKQLATPKTSGKKKTSKNSLENPNQKSKRARSSGKKSEQPETKPTRSKKIAKTTSNSRPAITKELKKKKPMDTWTAARIDLCNKLLEEFFAHPLAEPFLQPVDPVALDIPDYPLIIKHPMDLSTVQSKLQNGEYASAEAFAHDVRLIWSNAMKFNTPESAIYAMASDLNDLFLLAFPRIFISTGSVKNVVQSCAAELTNRLSSDELSEPEELTPEAKASLIQFLASLTGDLLRSMLHIIEQEMPFIFEGPEDELALDLDTVEPRLLARLHSFQTTCLSEDSQTIHLKGTAQQEGDAIQVEVDELPPELS